MINKKIPIFETWSERIFNFRSLQTSRQGFFFFFNVKDDLKEIQLKLSFLLSTKISARKQNKNINEF